MPTRFSNGIRPARQCFNGTRLRYAKMSQHIIDAWDYFITPEIKKDRCRADCTWDWTAFNRRQAKLARLLNQAPNAISIVVSVGSTGKFLPVGMMLLACNYKALHNPSEKAVFLWYISTAPKSALQKWLPRNQQPKGLGQVMIDLALTTSINLKYRGNIGLHAAKAASNCSDYLPGWYTSVGLNNLSAGIFISLARPNDGRYYFSDNTSAFSISIKFDHLR